jgi:DNA-binding MarR family transcriptional regulator
VEKTKNSFSLTTYNAGVIQSQAFRAMSNFMTERLVRYNLSLSEWKLLGHLKEVKNMTPSEISDFLSVKLPISSRLLKSLEAKGLLRRTQSKKDSRLIRAQITNKGEQLAGEIEGHMRQNLRQFLSDIRREDLEIYLRVMTKIANKVS